MLAILLFSLAVAETWQVVPESAAIVAVSPGVGAEINAVERRRFHLFPGIEDFASAGFSLMPDSAYSLTIADGSGRTVQYPIAPEQFRRIGYYVDHYGEVVNELAAVPGGRAAYLDLWQGIGENPGDTGTRPIHPPPRAAWTSQVVDGLTGAACGLGVGSTIGAMTAIKFVESRQESVLIHGCMSGGGSWYYYSVDVYDLDRTTYGAAAGAGFAAGAGAGWLQGSSQARRGCEAARERKGVAAHDLFGDPITDHEVRRRMQADNRNLSTILGAATGWVAGASVGLLAVAIARGVVLRPNAWDTIIIRHDGFSFDLPLIVFSLAGLLRGAYVGYNLGERQDWSAAVDALKRERLVLEP
ncbi:hypothetical protein FJY68_09120 [candidate division WOR-3 bacterium]|uniref:Uncharacterized protein n=1 Tax=candidate division WOR-3 bacterium TaxID=2052148 RepID=A0A938BUI4_UNCW3|nr:hypothetical protein [candidate division WOR-3 bacterium]